MNFIKLLITAIWRKLPYCWSYQQSRDKSPWLEIHYISFPNHMYEVFSYKVREYSENIE